jgi:hypothetical protein
MTFIRTHLLIAAILVGLSLATLLRLNLVPCACVPSDHHYDDLSILKAT